ncbi:MAG: AAA family ATPase [Candidatus Altiarchaeota archaeon]|nr:AAA family ATPase [Candidatus Altiarchaeota archaeon]
MERTNTGIKGLDKLLGGGIPKNHLVLLTGQTGAGKTILGLQYLIKGAIDYGEKGIYISFEQGKEDILLQAKQLGWDVEDLEKKELVKVLTFKPGKTHLTVITENLEENVKKFNPERLVFDSISTYGIYAETFSFFEMAMDLGLNKEKVNFGLTPESATRKTIMNIMEKIKSFNVTSLVISELPETTSYLSRDTISEFIADGVIILKHVPIGNNLNRSIEVRKMRCTEMGEGTYSYTITKKGIVVEG